MNGRYIANIFMYLNPISFYSFLGYKIAPTIMIFFMFLGNFLLVRELFYFFSTFKNLIISLSLGLLFFHNLPIISEGLYWYTGASIYQVGIIFTLFYFVLFIRIIKNRIGNIFLKNTLLSFLLFLICGFNEVLTLLILFTLFLTSVLFLKKQLVGKEEVLIQFALSMVFASFMIFAPGSEYRDAMYHQGSKNFSYSFIYASLQTIRFSFLWIASVPLICASVLYYPIYRKWKKHSSWVKNAFYFNKWISLLVLASIIFLPHSHRIGSQAF